VEMRFWEGSSSDGAARHVQIPSGHDYNANSVPENANSLPPPRHVLHDFLVLCGALECFNQWDISQRDDFGAFKDFPDAIGREDKSDVATTMSASANYVLAVYSLTGTMKQTTLPTNFPS
jgi:hypothetical protein